MISYFSLYGLVYFSLEGQKASLDYLRSELKPFVLAKKPSRLDFRILLDQPLPQKTDLLFNNRRFFLADKKLFFKHYCGFKSYLVGFSSPREKVWQIFYFGNRLLQRSFFLKYLVPLFRHFLLKKNFTLVKSSSVSLRGKGLLFLGWSGGGKTSLLLKSLAAGGYFLSDTFSLVSSRGEVFSFNQVLQVFGRNKKEVDALGCLSFSEKVSFLFKQLLFRVSGLNLSQFIFMEKIKKSDCQKATINQSFCLFDSAVSSCEKISPKELIEKIIPFQKEEFCFFDLLLWGWSFLGVHLPNNSYHQEKRLLKKALASADCYWASAAGVTPFLS